MQERVEIRVDNTVRVRMDVLPKKIVDVIKLEFTHDNPDYHLKRLLNLRGWWNEPKDVGTWGEQGKNLVIPRGGLRRVRDILEEHEIKYRLRDNRATGGLVETFPEFTGVPGSWKGYDDLYYYQKEAIEAALSKQNCVIRLPTGSGKSLMGLALATRARVNTLVVLPTVGLFHQWCDDAREVLKMTRDDLGVVHRKKRILRPLTATVQGTLATHGVDEELRDYFGMIIVDECQKCAARTFMKVVGAFPAKYRIGISADERRKDKKEFLTKGLFGSIAYEKKRKELEEEGYIVDVEIRVIPTDFEAPWYGLSEGEHDDRELDFNKLLDQMVLDTRRTKLGLKFIYEEIAAKEQALVLTHRREHCLEMDREFVRHQIPSGFFIGGPDYEKIFEATRNGIKDKTLSVGIGTYGALGVGVNLPAVAVGLATTPIASNPYFFNQVRGRFNRRGKARARLYALWDWKVYPKHLKNIVTWNPTVRVYHDGKWIEGRHYLKAAGKKVRL